VRAQGVRVALDDFGTGHAALSHLRQLPVDAIKLDVSLVAALERGGSDAEVVAGVVQLASAVGLHVVAEGVESAAADLLVARLGVHRAQGRHYGMAAPAPWPAGEPRFAPVGAPRRPARTVSGSSATP
jgi:diguanylate cyclase